MARNIVTYAAAAFLAGMSLNACSQGSQEAEAQNNQTAERAAPAVQNLPPSIQASRTYRCADNTLVYVDFFTDNTAAVRLEELGTPTRLAPENGAGAFKAEGYSVAANEASTSITLPGKPAQTCRART
jgi:crotonobetainyl-CoA:carnitine CoA-transferase CaiB-like acyl-CoA transferase